MATQPTPADALSSTPTTKKGVFSSGNSSRRQSLSNVSANSSIPQGIGYSPGSISSHNVDAPSPAGSGIPSFRTLRSLLPFGSSKNASPSNLSSPNTSRSPFSNFGSVRRSVNKERDRKSSLSNEATPVISIGPTPTDSVRRSVSLSRLEKPLPLQPDFGQDFSDSFVSATEGLSTSESRFTRRMPSPGPPAELSVIIEADSSGVSKHLPLIRMELESAESDSLMKPNAQSTLKREATKNTRKDGYETEGGTSTLELDHLTEEVREALRRSTSSTQSTSRWMEGAFEPVVIDGDEHPEIVDASFSFDGVNLNSVTNAHGKSSSPHRHQFHRSEKNPSPSPSTSTFPSSPGHISRLPRSRHASSFLPRLRSPQNISSPSASLFLPTPSPTKTSPGGSASTPKATGIAARTPAIALNGDDFPPTFPPRSPSSPGLSPASTSTPARRTMNGPRSTTLFGPPTTSASSSRTTRVLSGLMRSDSKSPNNTMNSSGLVSRTLRQVILGNNRSNDGSSGLESFANASPSMIASTPSRNSLDSRRVHHSSTPSRKNDIGLGRPSLETRRGSSFDSRVRPQAKWGTVPDLDHNLTTGVPSNVDSSPEASRPFESDTYRPSFDSARPSFDTSSRPGSVARIRERERERQRTPSLRVTDTTGERVPSNREAVYAAGRQRKRSMSVQERLPKARPTPDMAAAAITRPGSSASVHGARGARMGERELENGGGSGHERQAGGGGAPGPRMEWLGPRTAKAFRAAGLMDFDREEEQESRSAEMSNGMTRLRSGSIGGSSLPPSMPIPATSAASGLLSRNRFAPGRSASEYNPVNSRSHSRMAFSEIGGPTNHHSGRRGSGTFSAYGGSASAHGGGSQYGHTGLMESPTFTISSGSRERDTPKSSTSTAPTSLSESLGYLSRDRMERDRDRDEIRDLKDRHTSEMGALLGALSDTQRTVRMLREENLQLRDRLDQFGPVGQENDDLRHACEVLEREVIRLRNDYGDLQDEITASRSLRAPGGLSQSWSQSSVGSAGFKTPVAKQGNSSPLAIDTTPHFLQTDDDDEEVYNNTMIIHDDDDEDEPDFEDSRPEDHPVLSHMTHKSSSATPSLKRRLSNSSSIFPVPPANMTMLLDDDGASGTGEFNRNGADISLQSLVFSEQNGFKLFATPQSQSHSRSVSGTPPISFTNFARPRHHANKSITSTTSISPTTANFSMTTGSPRSLVLRPEHELLLGDMESLDLGAHDIDDANSSTSAIDRVASRNGW